MINSFLIFISCFVIAPEFVERDLIRDGDGANDLAPITALIALIANPGRYYNKRVLVGGYYLHDGPVHALCLQPRVASTVDCIYLDFKSQDDFRHLRGAPVYAEGLFQDARGNQSGVYSGSITPERFKKHIEIKSR